jgi:hypothetical protein
MAAGVAADRERARTLGTLAVADALVALPGPRVPEAVRAALAPWLLGG